MGSCASVGMSQLATLDDRPRPRTALRPDDDSPARPRRRPTARGAAGFAVAIAVALTAFAVRLWIALRGGGLGGTYGYDDGVYYAASSSLVWGRVPYRDFLLLHPPGIMLALTPFALIGRITRDHVGLETARVAWMLLGSLNAVLVYRVARPAGLAAAAAGGLFYAVWTPVAVTETTTRLEPLVSLGLLVALALLTGPLLTRQQRVPSRGLLLGAGAALAFSVSVKIWAVAPALLIVLWLWRRAGAGAAAWALAGGVAAVVLVDGPFLLAAPSRMVQMVVLDQLGRAWTQTSAVSRLAQIFSPGTMLPGAWWLVAALVVLGVCTAVLVCVACLGSAHGRFALSFLAVQVLVLVLSPSFFYFYTAFAGPALALVVAQVVAWVRALPRRSPTYRTGHRVHLRAGMGLVLAGTLTLGVVTGLVQDSQVEASAPFPGPALARVASSARCVTSDSPDALVLTDFFTRNLARGCQVPVDLSGLTYDRDTLPLRPNGSGVSRSDNPQWQHDFGSYMFSGRFIFVLRDVSDGDGGDAVQHLEGLTALEVGDAYTLLMNVAPPPHAGAGDPRPR